jgi:hypothetical protein
MEVGPFPFRRSAAKLLTKDEARQIAVNIAKLPRYCSKDDEPNPVPFNTSDSRPRTRSSPRRSLRSLRIPSRIDSHRATGIRRIRRTCSPAKRLSRPAEVVRHFPCRRHRTSTS